MSQVSTVSLVHSCLLQTQIMGEQKTNLLREVYCERTHEGIMYFEPTHLQWVACRKHFVETTEIEIAKNNVVNFFNWMRVKPLRISCSYKRLNRRTLNNQHLIFTNMQRVVLVSDKTPEYPDN